MATETIEVSGHIVDSLLLAKVLDTILDAGCRLRARRRRDRQAPTLDPSRARIEVDAATTTCSSRCSTSCRCTAPTGSPQATPRLVPADRDGVLPAGFYSTTNLATDVRIDGDWLPVENPEMDCGLVVRRRRTVRTVPMHRVRGRRPDRGRAATACGCTRRRTPRGASAVRVHGVRGVLGEAQGAARRRRSPTGIRAARDAGRQGAGRVRPGGGPHRRRARRRPPRRRAAGSTCCSPATASPPTTSSRTCSGTSLGVLRRRGHAAPRAATPTTCGSSTRCAATARSPPPSRPASSPAA